jgi:ABC-type bacteriocin/lantibiotic exporter with double-glycine peptidase domain
MRRRYKILLWGLAIPAAAVFLAFHFRYLLRNIPETPAPAVTSVQQVDLEYPCGIVSVIVATGALGQSVDFRQIKETIPTDALGQTSMAELVDGLEQLGFCALGVQLDARSLDRVGGPVILYVDRSHFLVVLPVGDGSAVLVDPPHPVRTVAISDLAGRWAGEAILVRKSEEEMRRMTAPLGISSYSARGKN